MKKQTIPGFGTFQVEQHNSGRLRNSIIGTQLLDGREIRYRADPSKIEDMVSDSKGGAGSAIENVSMWNRVLFVTRDDMHTDFGEFQKYLEGISVKPNLRRLVSGEIPGMIENLADGKVQADIIVAILPVVAARKTGDVDLTYLLRSLEGKTSGIKVIAVTDKPERALELGAHAAISMSPSAIEDVSREVAALRDAK